VPDALDALGAFFSVGRHDPALPPAEGWRPAGEIVTDPAVLDERIASVREFLASGGGLPAGRVEVRVAASVAHLGMAARLVSPLLATAVLHGRVPDLTLDDLRWKARLGGAFPLSLPRADGRPDGPGDGDGPGGAAGVGGDGDGGDGVGDSGSRSLAGRLSAIVVDGLALPLAGAFARFGVSEHILRGNSASALAGAARMLAAQGPGAAADARALSAALMRHPYLAGSGAYGWNGAFRRASCCLIYRAAPDRNGPLCGDCVLTSRPARSGTGPRPGRSGNRPG
jgi:hypothetical protein